MSDVDDVPATDPDDLDFEGEVSRPVALAIGCVLLLLGPVGLVAAIAIISDAELATPIARWIGGGVVGLCGAVSVIWGARLLSGRRHASGGLMSATALRLGGVLLLLLSLYRVLAAFYDDRGRIVAIAQAAGFSVFAVAAFIAARRRAGTVATRK